MLVVTRLAVVLTPAGRERITMRAVLLYDSPVSVRSSIAMHNQASGLGK